MYPVIQIHCAKFLHIEDEHEREIPSKISNLLVLEKLRILR
jgi:hypothetical protein